MEDPEFIEEIGEKSEKIDEKLPEKGKIDENTTIIVQNPTYEHRRSSLENTVKKMLNQKSINRANETKKLIEQDNINEIDLKTLLTADDNEYYQAKKELYLEKYPDLGEDPFDLDDLHLMIMEQILQRNLLKRKKKRPFTDIESDYAASVKRQAEAKKSLSMRRSDRVKDKSVKKQTLNIAQLSVIVSNPEEFTKKQAEMLQDEEEERSLRQDGKVVE